MVVDRLTGLYWTANANPVGLPVSWQEALELVAEMNQKESFGFSDWRLPNRRELRSLMCYQHARVSLPAGHPFFNVFSGWYWTSTTASVNPAYAWYIHMEGARMFYGQKNQYFLLWPVRGRSTILPVTGQKECFDSEGKRIPCKGSRQDGEFQYGVPWPVPRFEVKGDLVIDRLTNLTWYRYADITGQPVTWQEALEAVSEFGDRYKQKGLWRLPNINELESLVDCIAHSPALPDGHPFENIRDEYWSSTTSAFEPDWAWALYLNKGALGVGQKKGRYFYVWPVFTPELHVSI